MTAPAPPPQPPLTVLYDGGCPLCRREIGLYRGLQPTTPVCFADVRDAAVPLPPGTSRAQLLARFHVRQHDGQLLSGARAFLVLWAALPGWRWLALAGRLPGAVWAMERAYRVFLHARPALQHWASRLDGPQPGRTGTQHDIPRLATKEPCMSDDPRCCGSGTCIINPDGRCWCGQQWDGQRMGAAPLAQAAGTAQPASTPPAGATPPDLSPPGTTRPS